MSENTTDKKRFLGLNGIKLILDTLKEKYSPLGHTHDDLYYTEAEVDDLLLELTSGNTVVAKAEKAEHATNADKATNAEHSDEATHALNADNAVKAEQDTKGNVIDLTYETKEDAIAKLQEAKDYADVSIANLVDSAPETLDTLGELAAAFNENAELVDILNKAITEKATVDHVHSWYDLEDKPFEENLTRKEAIAETRIVFNNGVCRCSNDDFESWEWVVENQEEAYEAERNNELIVIFDGVEYKTSYHKDSDEVVYLTWTLADGTTVTMIDNCQIVSDSSIDGEHDFKVVMSDSYVTESIKQLDEKFIPDTIARVDDLFAPIQSDWNQNDETALDFIKNKPFYEYENPNKIIYEGTLVAEGDSSYQMLVFEKDFNPTLELGVEYTITVGDVITSNIVCSEYAGHYELLSFSEPFVLAYYDGYSIQTTNVQTVPLKIGESYNVKIEDTRDVIFKYLDEKFIPDTIATKEYVDEHILSKEEVITLLTETGFISPATTTSGDIYTDSDGDIYVM